MISQLSWKVGGQQGEGVESTGEIFAVALNRLGYYLYGYRHFSSRIKGGHTNNKIRVSTRPIRSISDDLDVLVAFDQETIDVNAHELNDRGVIIADAKFSPKLPDGISARLITVPLTSIAAELGTTLMKNMVAIGGTSALLDLPKEAFAEVIAETFTRKGDKIVRNNMEAFEKGAEFVRQEIAGTPHQLLLEKADGKKRLFMIGNDAIGLGAIAAGCRFMAAYPITPASDIMEYLIKHLPKFKGTVIQTEDEIAALTMAIGASYGGVRSMTASAGPGLSLMMEAIGLSGMTETPVVIVDTQRGGPSTGLPTKQEQSDIMAMIHGTHGEIPKIVLAPSSAEECFYDTIQAFNLADRYQCPVIILTDLALSLGKQSVEPFDFNRITIDRGKLIDDETELPKLQHSELFQRYELTEDGISPRPLPGKEGGIHHVTGVEHNEFGRPSEESVNRENMMKKRMRKFANGIDFDTPVNVDAKHEEPDLLIVGINSTTGTIQEAKSRLEAEGMKVNHAHLRLLHPFPATEIEPLMRKAKKVVVVENNATGQITDLLKLHVGMRDKLVHYGKFDGNPFLPAEIYNYCKELA